MSQVTDPDKISAGIGKGTPGPGRGKGNPNKLTKDVKAMILGALDDAGGQKYLAQQATLNPAAFMTLVGKCLPREIVGKDGAPLIPSVIQFVSPGKAAK
jgi:hypothetical protein